MVDGRFCDGSCASHPSTFCPILHLVQWPARYPWVLPNESPLSSHLPPKTAWSVRSAHLPSAVDVGAVIVSSSPSPTTDQCLWTISSPPSSTVPTPHSSWLQRRSIVRLAYMTDCNLMEIYSGGYRRLVLSNNGSDCSENFMRALLNMSLPCMLVTYHPLRDVLSHLIRRDGNAQKEQAHSAPLGISLSSATRTDAVEGNWVWAKEKTNRQTKLLVQAAERLAECKLAVSLNAGIFRRFIRFRPPAPDLNLCPWPCRQSAPL